MIANLSEKNMIANLTDEMPLNTAGSDRGLLVEPIDLERRFSSCSQLNQVEGRGENFQGLRFIDVEILKTVAFQEKLSFSVSI